MPIPPTRCRRASSAVVALALSLVLVVPPGTVAAASVEHGAATPEALVARLQAAAADEDFATLAACLAPEDRAMMSLMMLLGAGMMTAFAQMGAGMAEGMAEMGAELAEGMAEGLAESMGGEVVEGQPADAGAAEAEAAAEAPAEADSGRDELAAMAAQAAGMAERYEALLERHGVAELMEEETPPGPVGPEAAAELFADVDQVALIADLVAFMHEEFPEETGGEDAVPVPTGELSGLAVEGDAAHGRIGEEEVDFVRLDGRWYLDLPDPPPPEEMPAGEPAPEPEG